MQSVASARLDSGDEGVMQHILLLVLLVTAMGATEWYVSGSGNDGNTGRSSGAAFRTLQQAAGRVAAGDTVWVMDGLYTPSWTDGEVLTITTSGTADAWITWKAMPGHRPELKGIGWNIVKVDASYQVIEGLTITGNNDNITLAEAEADGAAAGYGSPHFNTNGLSVDCRSKSAPFHHITLRNLHVRKCPGGGISAIQADLITVEGCLVEQCAWYMRYAGSGISLYQSWGSGIGSPTWRNIVRNNIVRDNRCLVRWVATGDYSDGNGIIIDDNRHTQNGSTRGAYAGRTLVAGNLSVNNGGSGIHAYSADHVDIVNNTTYHNGTKVGYAEIFGGDAADVRIMNNIMYARDGGKVNTANNNVNVTYTSNVYWNGTVAAAGTGTLTADPRLRNPSTDPAVADFRLRADSPARNSGAVLAGATDVADLLGMPRPQGAAVDRGAYEFDLTAPTAPPAPSVANQATATPTLSGTTEPGATVRIYDGGVLVATVTANGAGSWSWTASPALAVGTHQFTVTATDGDGNTSTASAPASVTVASAGGGGPAATPGSADGGSGCGAGALALLLALGHAMGVRKRKPVA